MRFWKKYTKVRWNPLLLSNWYNPGTRVYNIATFTHKLSTSTVIRHIVCKELKEWNRPAERLRLSELLQPSVKCSASELMHEKQPNTLLFLRSSASTLFFLPRWWLSKTSSWLCWTCLIALSVSFITDVLMQLFSLWH